MKKWVIRKLKDSIYLTVSTELWTDHFRKIPYITIVAHFISSGWKSERFFLLTRAFLNEHTGENVKGDLQSAVEEFKMSKTDETPTIVCDQGSNVLLAATCLSTCNRLFFRTKSIIQKVLVQATAARIVLVCKT